jgi:hypothetical protein
LSFLLYSYFSRFSGFDVDLVQYTYAMQSDTYSIYYLKEPIFWLGSRVLFSLFNSAEWVFITFDMLCFYVVLKSIEISEKPKYLIVILFIFFPSVMGLQNVYRQFLAVSFIVSSILVCNKKSNYSWFLFFIAVLSQNSVAIFLPLLLKLRNKNFLAYLTAFCVFALLPLAVSTKSSSDTGLLGPEVYIIVLSLLFAFSFMLVFFSRKRRFEIILFPYGYLLMLLVESTFLMGSGQSKRVGMMSLLIYLLIFSGLIESSKNMKFLLRLILFILCFIPTFMFSSTMQFFT